MLSSAAYRRIAICWNKTRFPHVGAQHAVPVKIIDQLAQNAQALTLFSPHS